MISETHTEVPCLHIGRRTFINLDVLVSFLNNPDNYFKEAGKQTVTTIQ